MIIFYIRFKIQAIDTNDLTQFIKIFYNDEEIFCRLSYLSVGISGT